MEKEISSGTMLGIVLIALAAVIGLGFGVFSIAKGVANEGVVNVQDNLGSVSESAFEDFDQKIVTGTQVKSAYKQFQGKPVAVLINTQAMNNGVAFYSEHIDKHGFVDNVAAAPAPATPDTLPDTPATGVVTYVNYNALLGEGNITLSSGVFSFDGSFVVGSSGKIVFDSNIGGQSKAGNSEYINTGAKFDANLIKDSSGTIVGVVFTQLSR